jgi:hypothetical protein
MLSSNDVGFLSAIGQAASFLTDRQIRLAVEMLDMIGGAYRADSARYGSYELHASEDAFKLIYEGEFTCHVEYPPRDGEFFIPAGATVKINTAETIRLPPYIFANVVVLGQHFSVGLAGGSTYVDPGSVGPIYLSFTNVSSRTIRIPVGAPLARAQFFVLSECVERAHEGPGARRALRLRVEPPPGTLETDIASLRASLQRERRLRQITLGATVSLTATVATALLLALHVVSDTAGVMSLILSGTLFAGVGIRLALREHWYREVLLYAGVLLAVASVVLTIVLSQPHGATVVNSKPGPHTTTGP